MDILDQLELVKSLDIEQMMDDSIEDNEAEIIDTITETQMLSGKSSTDEIIGEYSSPIYARYKSSLNSKAGFGHVDLKVTGDLFSSFVLKKISGGFEINSNLSYFTKLIKKYGVEPFDLSDENAKMVAKGYIIDSFIKFVKNGLRM